MPEYMLDTDTVSFALRGRGRVAARLREHRPSELCISSITLAELRYGAEARRSRKLHRLISTFVEAIEVMSFDQLPVDLPWSQRHWLGGASRSARSTPSWRLMRCPCG
jgi:hypothetical protein